MIHIIYSKTATAAAVKVKLGFKIVRFAQFPDSEEAIMPLF